LSSGEFFRVSQCNSAKEMWDILEVTHEGTSDVKRVEPSGVQVLKNPNPLKDVEALVVLDVVVLV